MSLKIFKILSISRNLLIKLNNLLRFSECKKRFFDSFCLLGFDFRCDAFFASKKNFQKGAKEL